MLHCFKKHCSGPLSYRKSTVIKQKGKLWPYKAIDSHSVVGSAGVQESEKSAGWLQKAAL